MARDPALVTAIAASLALAATLFLIPDAPWRAPLALLAGVWAPGYAVVALAYPRGRLSALERHALAAGAGLALLPVLGLTASFTVGFRPTSVAGAAVVVTLGAGLAARRRASVGEEPIARSPAPSWRQTTWIVAGALVLAAVVVAPTIVARDPAPHALALTDASGAPLDLDQPPGAPLALRIEAFGGDAGAAGDLVVRWGEATVLARALALDPGASTTLDVEVTLDAEERKLSASWAGREVHATFHRGTRA